MDFFSLVFPGSDSKFKNGINENTKKSVNRGEHYLFFLKFLKKTYFSMFIWLILLFDSI
jgi:hypothetical protein